MTACIDCNNYLGGCKRALRPRPAPFGWPSVHPDTLAAWCGDFKPRVPDQGGPVFAIKFPGEEPDNERREP